MPDFVITNSNDLHERIGKAVAAIAAQNAPAQVGKNVYVSIVPLFETAALPCVFCTWEGEVEQQDMDFEGNVDKYPVKVMLFDRADLHDQTNRGLYLAWRKTLMDAFRPLQSLGPSVPEVWNVEVKPQVIFDPQVPAYQHLVSGFTVYAHAWEQRPKL